MRQALLRAFIKVGLLRDADAEGLDPDRLLEFYRAALRDRWDEQPYTYTPESVAEIVAATYQPLGPWSDVTGRLQMPKDLLFLNGSPSAPASYSDTSTPPPTGSRSTARSGTTDRRPRSWGVGKPRGARSRDHRLGRPD